MDVITQHNLWHRGPGKHGYVWKSGLRMTPVEPKLGETDSADPEVAHRELKILTRFIGEERLVLAFQWMKPGDYIDRVLRNVYLPVMRDFSSKIRFLIFYDQVLAAKQREMGSPPFDWRRPEFIHLFQDDLIHLQDLFEHPAYYRREGKPVLYVWALHGNDSMGDLLATSGCYVLGDVYGRSRSWGRPRGVDAYTGFVSTFPGMPQQQRTLLRDVRKRIFDEALYWRGQGPHVPAASCQYDDHAFMEALMMGTPPTQVLARSEAEISSFLSELMDTSSTAACFIGTTNNWAEGTTILPTARPIPRLRPRFSTQQIGNYGNSHLRAIRKALRGR